MGTELATTFRLKRQKILIAFLIEHRKAAGLTQAQLADGLGKSRSFITRLESGRRRVYVVDLLQLAEVLGFDAGKALGRLKRWRESSGSTFEGRERPSIAYPARLHFLAVY